MKSPAWTIRQPGSQKRQVSRKAGTAGSLQLCLLGVNRHSSRSLACRCCHPHRSAVSVCECVPGMWSVTWMAEEMSSVTARANRKPAVLRQEPCTCRAVRGGGGHATQPGQRRTLDQVSQASSQQGSHQSVSLSVGSSRSQSRTGVTRSSQNIARQSWSAGES